MWYALFCPLSGIDFRGSALAFIFWFILHGLGEMMSLCMLVLAVDFFFVESCWDESSIVPFLTVASAHCWFHEGEMKIVWPVQFWVENWVTIQILWTTPIISGLSNPCIHAEPSTRVF
jgi:hypothetical protein